MKTKPATITYWIATVLVCGMMAMSAFAYLTKDPKMVTAFTNLGYPLYFMTILGVAKSLGIVALLAPRFATLKEWAYAGFAYCCIGAGISHLTMNENPQALIAFGTLLPLGLSYFLRPDSRRYAVIATATVITAPRTPAEELDIRRASRV